MEALSERAIGDDWSALHRRIRERDWLTTGGGHVAVDRGVTCEVHRSARAIPATYLATADDVRSPEGGRECRDAS